MKTVTHTENFTLSNGNEFRIEIRDDGSINVRQRDTNLPLMGAEWKTIGYAELVNGKITERAGLVWENDEANDAATTLETKLAA